MEKLNRAQKCSILGPQNLGSGGPGPLGPPLDPHLCDHSKPVQTYSLIFQNITTKELLHAKMECSKFKLLVAVVCGGFCLQGVCLWGIWPGDGGVFPEGVSVQGGCLSRGVFAQGGCLSRDGVYTTPCEEND